CGDDADCVCRFGEAAPEAAEVEERVGRGREYGAGALELALQEFALHVGAFGAHDLERAVDGVGFVARQQGEGVDERVFLFYAERRHARLLWAGPADAGLQQIVGSRGALALAAFLVTWRGLSILMSGRAF